MLILRDCPGKLCNRMWAYSFFIAFALKHRLQLIIPFFDRYKFYFENLNRYPYVVFTFSKNKFMDKVLTKCFQKLERLLASASTMNGKLGVIYLEDNGSIPALLKATRSKVVLINSWAYLKDTQAMMSYSRMIRILFQPKENYRRKAERILTMARLQSDVLIGIHVRRGDYKAFMNGNYYYEIADYHRVMSEVQEDFNQCGKKVSFFISSDEPISLNLCKGMNCYWIENSHVIEDLYALSQCNLILGPPSTYSMWASFWGEKPIQFIRSKDYKVTKEAFQKVLFQNYFEGRRFFDFYQNTFMNRPVPYYHKINGPQREDNVIRLL
ncbi:alpha-1,2-fucosyltransferase [Rapidithrix thailandica]|uniref:Alpha-1,2-fucosyltransferase n=1 Tax=Rapidithrix thailandica TaxID=413964 RepID=A0AAW9RUZ6_9BACT